MHWRREDPAACLMRRVRAKRAKRAPPRAPPPECNTGNLPTSDTN